MSSQSQWKGLLELLSSLKENIDKIKVHSTALGEQVENIDNVLKVIQKSIQSINEWETGVMQVFGVLDYELKDPQKHSNGAVDSPCQKNSMKKNLEFIARTVREIKKQTQPFLRLPKISPLTFDEKPGPTSKWQGLESEDEITVSPAMADAWSTYDYLEPHLKVRFLCLSIFPENSIIKKRTLKYWWIGEDFAVGGKEGNKTPEDSADHKESNKTQEDYVDDKEANKTPEDSVGGKDGNKTPEDSADHKESNKTQENYVDDKEANKTPEDSVGGKDGNKTPEDSADHKESNKTQEDYVDDKEANKTPEDSVGGKDSNKTPEDSADHKEAKKTRENYDDGKEADKSQEDSAGGKEANKIQEDSKGRKEANKIQEDSSDGEEAEKNKAGKEVDKNMEGKEEKLRRFRKTVQKAMKLIRFINTLQVGKKKTEDSAVGKEANKTQQESAGHKEANKTWGNYDDGKEADKSQEDSAGGKEANKIQEVSADGKEAEKNKEGKETDKNMEGKEEKLRRFRKTVQKVMKLIRFINTLQVGKKQTEDSAGGKEANKIQEDSKGRKEANKIQEDSSDGEEAEKNKAGKEVDKNMEGKEEKPRRFRNTVQKVMKLIRFINILQVGKKQTEETDKNEKDKEANKTSAGDKNEKSKEANKTSAGDKNEKSKEADKSREDFEEVCFKKLCESGLIEPIYDHHSTSPHSCRLHPWIRWMATRMAKETKFFDFESDGKPSSGPYVCPRRACVVTAGEKQAEKIHFEPYASELLSLFNVDVHYLECDEKDFKKLNNMKALQLGKWIKLDDYQIEVVNSTFLNHLGLLEKLRYLGLQGISRIPELPDSITKLSELRILDLRACHHLLKLPMGITSLKKLTHLDVSECYLLEYMPKGLGSLSDLQFLAGFVSSKWENLDACKLNELTTLQKLRKLGISLTVEAKTADEELDALKNIECLQTLTITWAKGVTSLLNENDKQGQTLTGVKSKISFSLPPKLSKLDLRCFPDENVSELLAKPNNLKKLYFRGGRLKSLSGLQICEVETVRFRLLKIFSAEWQEMHYIFPNLKYVDIFECPGIKNSFLDEVPNSIHCCINGTCFPDIEGKTQENAASNGKNIHRERTQENHVG